MSNKPAHPGGKVGERAWRAVRRERIRKIAKEHPDMPLELLMERFGAGLSEISEALQTKPVIRRERDWISAWLNARHRYNRYGT